MTNNNIRSAEEIINSTIKWELDCKEAVVAELLEIINKRCESAGAQYFIVGKLMDHVLYGTDILPEAETYEIYLMREDYDKLIEDLRKGGIGKGCRFCNVYSAAGTINNRVAFLTRRQQFSETGKAIDVKCRINLVPLDALPEDAEEKKKFLYDVAVQSKEYLKHSVQLNFYRSKKNRNTFAKRIISRAKAFFFRGGVRDSSAERKENYHKLLTSYAEGKKTDTFGVIEITQKSEYRRDQIYPLKKGYFRNVPVSIPEDAESFSLRPGEKNAEEKLAERLKLLRTFDEYCGKHGVDYFLGWKPASSVVDCNDMSEEVAEERWDIGLPRKDYNKLIAALREDPEALRLLDTVPGMPAISRLEIRVALAESYDANSLDSVTPLLLLAFDNLPDNFEEGTALCCAAVDAYERLKAVVAYETGSKYTRLLPGEDSNSAFARMHETWASCSSDTTDRLFAVRNGNIVIVDRRDMLPVQRWSLRDFSVNLPAEQYYWHYDKDPKYVDYIAGKKTALLKKLDAFCNDKNIRYFAIASLLIGAAVYHDAVPDEKNHRWDVGMIREEYERFLREIRENGAQYGISLKEFFDNEKKLPIDRKRVHNAEDPQERVYISLVPFDKDPEDFYLCNGLENMLQKKNEFFRQLMKEKRFPYKENVIPFKGEQLAEYLEYAKTADPNTEYEKIDKLAQSFSDTDRPYLYRGICFSKTRRITEADLFPLQRLKFRDIEINCPKDYSVWQPVINEELNRQVECIQRADIILLKTFDEVCSKLGLGYFVCGGTMLGYVRHGGFIPWDDDVDVAMLRADYDEFLAKAGPLLPEGFFLQTRETDKTIPYLFSKIRLNDTAYVTEYSMTREYHQGICLDIFPFDYLPNNEKERDEFLKEIKKLAKIHHVVATNQLAPPEEKIVPQNETEKMCLEYEEDILSESWGTDLAKTQADYLAVATRYNSVAKEKKLKTVGSFVPSYTYIDLNDLLPYQRGKFEDIEVSVPKRPDIFLEMQYGDYMQLPPEHNRIAHRLVRWKTWEGSGGIAVEGENVE